VNYNDYISLQKRKTTDPIRRHKWLNEEWDIKLHGFNRIFSSIQSYINGPCLCLGARTGQEVQALRDKGYDAIGVDLVGCEPLVKSGDFHDLPFDGNSFSFIFSNSVDHLYDPAKFFTELLRVAAPNCTVLFHLQVEVPNDEFGTYDIDDINSEVLSFLPSASVIHLKQIFHPEFATFNTELLLSLSQ
jgi:SAM-dependent methyltransferase